MKCAKCKIRFETRRSEQKFCSKRCAALGKKYTYKKVQCCIEGCTEKIVKRPWCRRHRYDILTLGRTFD